MFYRSALSIGIIFLFSVPALSTTVIPATDRNILAGLSPYNWVRHDGFISSTVCGASVTVGFKGTARVTLMVETGHMIFEAPARYPVIAWTVNDGPVTIHQLTAGEKTILLSNEVQDPVIDLYIKGMSPFEDRYNDDLPLNSVKISGFMADETGSAVRINLPRKVWLTFGDSILSGDGAAVETNQGRPADDMWAASGNARASYGYLLSRHFGFRESRVAYGGYDWGGGMANMPALSVLIDSTTSSFCRLNAGKLCPAPGVVLINLGENGAPDEKDVTRALTRLRSRVDRKTKIIVMVPVSGRARAEVTSAFNNYKASAKDQNAYLVDLENVAFATGDGQHPTAAGHQSIYQAALPAFQRILKGNAADENRQPEKAETGRIPVWPGPAPDGEGNFSDENAFITVHHPSKPNGAMVIICPGGGYGGLVTGPEGHGIAGWLNQHGITGVVLEYRLPKGRQEVPLLDAQRAIRIARSKAGEWCCDPKRIGIIGFSAGGHLASTAATHFDSGNRQAKDKISRISCRPDFAMLIYPVITMGPMTHRGSKNNLLGPDSTADLVDRFSNEKQVTVETPPTFLAHALDDDVVSPVNSQQFYDALISDHLPAWYVKLPSGGHGLNGYSGPMWDEWQAESLKWLASLDIIPGEKAQVEIDSKMAGPVISPLVFGHNLEVTRRGIWSGLSAEMIANRKFAAVENQLPKHWLTVGDGASVSIDTTVANAGRQSVRILVKSDAPAGISQMQEMLSVSQGSHYDVRAWIRTEITRNVQLRLAGKSGEVLLDTTISCRQGDWQLISAGFTAAVTKTTCLFAIVSQDIGTYWIGSVSMMPSDAFHGMRRDVIELVKTIKPGILRFPGGCYAEFYSWKDGLMPADQRPPITGTGLDFLFRNTDGTDTQEIGIDEFMALCREVGCEPAITVRLSENIPADAAAWVEYCNGAAGTKWGDIRISRGHTVPYNVRWWFVGNELYGFGRGKASWANGCAEQTRLFAGAMKQADPSIHLVPSTLFGSGDMAESWNLPLLESTENLIDAVTAHQYILDKYPLRSQPDYAQMIRSPELNTLPMLRKTRDFLDRNKAAGNRTGLTYDEWNTRWGLEGSIPMGLYAASMLNMLCREAQSIGLEMACFFMPVNEGAIRVDPLSARLDAAGYVFELFGVHQGNRLLQVPCPSSVDLCASITPGGEQIFITLVNGITGQQAVSFSLPDGPLPGFSNVIIKQLIPKSLSINETEFNISEERVRINRSGKFKVKLEPGAIARIQLLRDS